MLPKQYIKNNMMCQVVFIFFADVQCAANYQLPLLDTSIVLGVKIIFHSVKNKFENGKKNTI
jgi:hypothetical protein